MPELHPTQCACQDCRSRRLIRNDDLASERKSADEPEDSGYRLNGSRPAANPAHGNLSRA